MVNAVVWDRSILTLAILVLVEVSVETELSLMSI